MHGWFGAWLPTLVLLHVLSAFAFVLFHGPSVAVMLILRRERELTRVKVLLELSRRASAYSWPSWIALAGTGALLATTQHIWRAPWVWGSAVVLVVASGIMSPLAARRFNEARIAAGLAWFDGIRLRDGADVDGVALDMALGRIRSVAPVVTVIGSAALLVLVWLMVVRPG